MDLQDVIAKEEDFEKLEPHIKILYKKDDKGAYNLNINTAFELNQSLAREKQVNAELKKKPADPPKQPGEKPPEIDPSKSDAENAMLKAENELLKKSQFVEKKRGIARNIISNLNPGPEQAKILVDKVAALINPIGESYEITAHGINTDSELVDHIKKTWSFLLDKPHLAVGGGAPGGASGDAATAPQDLSKLPPTARIVAARQAAQKS